MALETTNDLAAYFDTDEHGTASTYTEQGQSATTVNGIFENEFYETIEGGFVGLESSQPIFLCQTTDVSNATHGDTIVISSTTYLVKGVQNDGTGVTKLILEEQ